MVLRIKRAKLNLRRTIRQPVGPGIILDDRERLRLRGKLRHPPTAIRFSASFTENIDELLKRVRELSLEGLVGKRAGSKYDSKRLSVWIKIKLYQQGSFVAGGYACAIRSFSV
jgi:bifunctional non-homologous end joining protein LigD